jgi:hypothetical protein
MQEHDYCSLLLASHKRIRVLRIRDKRATIIVGYAEEPLASLLQYCSHKREM